VTPEVQAKLDAAVADQAAALTADQKAEADAAQAAASATVAKEADQKAATSARIAVQAVADALGVAITLALPTA
jgi:hypothetical protein